MNVILPAVPVAIPGPAFYLVMEEHFLYRWVQNFKRKVAGNFLLFLFLLPDDLG